MIVVADIYDIKAVDIDNKIYFLVQFEIGQKSRMVPADMKFYMEVPVENREMLERELPRYDWSPGMNIVELGWTDTDGNPLISIEYISLEQKKLFVQTFNELYIHNADLSEERLWMQYHGHVRGDFMRKPLFFDTEVDPTDINRKMESTNNAVKYNNRFLMIGMSNQDKSYSYIDDDEKSMLMSAYSRAKQHSCLIGWSSGGHKRSFDIPYLMGRSAILGLKQSWDKIPHLDLMYCYKDYKRFNKELGEVVHLGLDDVSELHLGYGKTEKAYHKLLDWFKNDRLSLDTYCMNDVYLMMDLYKKIDGLRDVLKVEVIKRKLGCLDPNDSYISSFVEKKFCDLARDMKIGIPNGRSWKHRDTGKVCPFCNTLHDGDFDVEVCSNCGEDIKKTGAGGLVSAPNIGLSYNTIFVDFQSLYPTIYMTHNIGINTVDWDNSGDNIIKTEELNFFEEPRSLNAIFMEWLLVERMKYRKARDSYIKGTPEYAYNDLHQQAFKDIMVSANGVLEQKYFKFKNQKIYNSCTKTGQIYAKFLVQAGKEIGLEVKSLDTDGIHYISPYKDVEETIEHLEEIETYLCDRVKELAMERWELPEKYYSIYPRCEKICSHFFSIAKKSYIMKIIYDDGKHVERFDAKGMPGVKYNTLELLKEILKNIFKEVIFKLPPGADYVSSCVDYLLALKDDLFSGRRDDLLMYSQGVDKLGGRLPWDRAAAKLDEMGKFEPGMIIRYIKRKGGDIILPDYEDYEVDYGTYHYYWTGAVCSWIKRLLPDVVGIRELGFEEVMPNATFNW